MNGSQFLDKARDIFEKRKHEYGDPIPLFEDIAKRWSYITGAEISPAQVVQCMIELKLARLVEHPGHKDSILDIAGYAACLAEVAQ